MYKTTENFRENNNSNKITFLSAQEDIKGTLFNFQLMKNEIGCSLGDRIIRTGCIVKFSYVVLQKVKHTVNTIYINFYEVLLYI